MTATAAEALELALWLHRVPSRRAALLGRPLPEGIGQLLRVAGGASDQVAAAARITGEDEATVLEAVRFYLQQILFHDDADAYRVLGLHPNATHAQAREHHRLLQHWLHPDRRGQDEWESIYAGRVNRAWTQLRTPQARAAYNDALGAEVLNRSRHVGDPRLAAPSIPMADRERAGTRSRNVTIAVLAGCACLLVLIALRKEEPPKWNDDRKASVPAPAPVVAADSAAPEAALLATIDALSAGVASPSLAAPPPDPVRSAMSADGPPVERAIATAAVAPAVSAPAPQRERRVLAVNTATVAPHPAPVPAAPPPARLPRPVVRQSIESAPQVAVLDTDAAAIATTAPPALPASPASSSRQRIPDPLARMTQVRSRARQVLDFLGDPRAVQPPVWNDLPTARRAEAIRDALEQRMPAGARIDVLDPQWRLSGEGARLEARYRADPGRRGQLETGRLDLDFVYRQDQLLVRGVSLVPGA